MRTAPGVYAGSRFIQSISCFENRFPPLQAVLALFLI